MKKILVLGAHPDDIELGMAGHLSQLEDVQVWIASESSNINTEFDMRTEAMNSLIGVLGVKSMFIAKYKTMYFRKYYQEIRDEIFHLKNNNDFDTIFCPSINSIHPDHQVIAEACTSIFIEQTIYSYEPLRSAEFFRPNKFVKIGRVGVDLKINALSCYKSQMKKPEISNATVIHTAGFYGAKIRVDFAEAFEVVREVS